MRKHGWISFIVLSLSAAGCGSDTSVQPEPLPGPLPGPTDARRIANTPISGAIDTRPMDTGTIKTNSTRGQLSPRPNDPRPGVSDSVTNTIRSPRDEAVARAGLGTSASTLPMSSGGLAGGSSGGKKTVPGVGTGNAMLLGTVVVEVNGHPIFANKVLQTIAPVLGAKAKDLDAQRFRALATDEIRKQLRTLINDELQFALAERTLDANEKRIADAHTMQWRDQQIRKAGGSLQVVRQQAAAQGLDFDELVQDQNRLSMRQVYFARKELPKIQISADDMRRYYQRHKDEIFTERSQAQFRVIKIDFARTGGREAALKKANDIHARVSKGEDFATIAGETNDDPFLMHSKGDVTGGGGAIDRGAYINQKVEDAAWGLHNGEIAPVVESSAAGNGAFYIVKLEQKKVGRVLSFDEEAVQSRIRQQLEAEQMAAMQQQMTEQLIKNAIIVPDPQNIEPVVDMAMQKYIEWTAKN